MVLTFRAAGAPTSYDTAAQTSLEDRIIQQAGVAPSAPSYTSLSDFGAKYVTLAHTSATCGSVPCTAFTVTISVPQSADASVIAQTLMTNLIGSGCLDIAQPNKCNHRTASSRASTALQISVLPVWNGGSKITISSPGYSASSNGDPHLSRADGYRLDMRGRDGKDYNLLSARNYSLAVRTTESHFMQKHSTQRVNGTHFTRAGFVARTNTTGKLVTALLTADITPWFYPITYVTVDGGKPIKLSPTKQKSVVVEDVSVTILTGSKVSVRGAAWEVTATRRTLYKPLAGSKTRNYLDFAIRRTTTRAIAAHGIIGQSFDPRHRITKDGRLDDYSSAEVTTVAQGEGALEGVYTDYMVDSPLSTSFKFSLFDVAASAALPRIGEYPTVTASTNTDEAAEQV